MSKIKSIILKGVYNERFEEIFCNKKDNIEIYKNLNKNNKLKGEGKIYIEPNLFYYKTFIPENENQSIFYIIYCDKTYSKEKIDDCFEEIDGILNENRKFSLNNFPKKIKEEIKTIFEKFEFYEIIVLNLNINDNNGEKDNLEIENNEEKKLEKKLMDENNDVFFGKKENKNCLDSILSNLKIIYLVICGIILVLLIISMIICLPQKKKK
jgi:hypothetical protein